MAQTQVSDGSKYAQSRHPWTRTWMIFAVIAPSAALAIGMFRIGAYQSAMDAARSAINAATSRAPAVALQQESPMLVREGANISVPEESPLRGKLTVAPVGQQEIQRKLVLPAVVEADPARTVKVLPPVTGRVTDLKVQLGERVEQGQELAVIDSGDLALAYSDIEKAKSVRTLTKAALDRQLALEKAGGTAIKDREQAQSDYNQAIAELERAEVRLRAMGVPEHQQKEQSRLLSIKAPVSGSVIDLQVARGAYLNDPTAAIMTIANLGTVWVTANVPERDTALVTKGQDVDVVLAAYPGEVFASKVLFISDVLDPDTRRTKVRIAFDNPDIRLKPNMFADATFVAPKQMVDVVPTSALVLKNESDQVFVEVAPWTFEARTVEVGFQQGDQAVIKSGLKASERIVVKGGVLLND
ncbi:MAG TPA: efflux RND transporter periplasmic adaptor subunit [Xanthobacteraceae bacterium]|nr:efflux RND transporter periplasmic adaptor subunit [Xanthobacteraceae bacterium]